MTTERIQGVILLTGLGLVTCGASLLHSPAAGMIVLGSLLVLGVVVTRTWKGRNADSDS